MADVDGHRLGGAQPTNAPESSAPPQGGPHPDGKKIAVDFAEAKQALDHLKAAYDALDRAYRDSFGLAFTAGPGNEQPSRKFATKARQVAELKCAEIVRQRDAVAAMYDNLKAQLDSQRKTEEANTSNVHHAGG